MATTYHHVTNDQLYRHIHHTQQQQTCLPETKQSTVLLAELD